MAATLLAPFVTGMEYSRITATFRVSPALAGRYVGPKAVVADRTVTANAAANANLFIGSLLSPGFHEVIPGLGRPGPHERRLYLRRCFHQQLNLKMAIGVSIGL
jgi:hypothetical protein